MQLRIFSKSTTFGVNRFSQTQKKEQKILKKAPPSRGPPTGCSQILPAFRRGGENVLAAAAVIVLRDLPNLIRGW